MKVPSKAKTAQRIVFTLAIIQTIRLITMMIAIAMVEELLPSSLVPIKLSLITSSLTQETISRIYTMTQVGPMVPARTILSRTLSNSLDPAPITQTNSQTTLQPLPLPIQATITTILSQPLRMTTVTYSRISPFMTHPLRRTRSCLRSRSAVLRLASSPSICRLRTQLHRVIRVS
jgi:hypothetical protein